MEVNSESCHIALADPLRRKYNGVIINGRRMNGS